jgi:hypothetical protein
MAVKDLATTVNRWRSGAGAAQQSFVDGVQRTDKDPTALAIANAQGMLQNVTESITSGRWQRNLAAVGKVGWQQATVAKAANYGTGIAAGEQSYSEAMATWLPRIDAAATAARNMPGATLQQRLARANAFATALYNAKRQ